MAQADIRNQRSLTFAERVLRLNWLVILLICGIGAAGITMLLSAAGGSVEPWAHRQAIHFGIGLVLMLAVSVTDIRLWLRLAYAFYGLTFVLLVGVELLGATVMGAQRWVDLGVVQAQPSELMKAALILALARYFHGISLDDMRRVRVLVPPVLMILAPAALVLRQPDLGTAVLLVLCGTVMLFLAGLKPWKLGAAVAAALATVPIAWQFLRDYQKARVLTFFDPESDPLGTGYHIIQSKIALGSGGVLGKGYLKGTQSHLNFLPEKQTDFIFTMVAEEYGFLGAGFVLLLYFSIATCGIVISVRSENHFGRLLGMGVTVTFFFHVFFNIAMVMGLLPVVGLPLPLMSYGGSAMVSLMLGFGFLICVHVHRDVPIARRSASGPP